MAGHGGRNIVVCCDGTWNKPDGEASTNVWHTFLLAADQDSATFQPDRGYVNEHAAYGPLQQVCHYHVGVGALGNRLVQNWDGATGSGIRANMIAIYRWIAQTYQDGDRLFLFGFSRGAYTARSIAGMISCCGLLYPEHASETDDVFEIYRDREAFHYEDVVASLLNGKARPVEIHCLGVWDTVGALGVPIFGFSGNLLAVASNQFHDVSLSEKVRHAYHALAMDERRPSFVPTLWRVDPRNVEKGQKVEQAWFRGVHSDVGGGYPERSLANIAFAWMMDRAAEAGLAFDKARLQRYRDAANADGAVHDSLGSFWKWAGAWPRGFPRYTAAQQYDPSFGYLHDSAWLRKPDDAACHGQNDFRPRLLTADSPPETLKISAKPWWNRTGIMLHGGFAYRISAQGSWSDASTECGPNGWREKSTDLAFALFRRFRRKRDANWFALVGLVNNPEHPDEREVGVLETIYYLLIEDPREFTSRLLTIGEQTIVRPERSGMLYLFANDLWTFYGNNSGEITVTVTPVRDEGQPQGESGAAQYVDARLENRLANIGFWAVLLGGIAAIAAWVQQPRWLFLAAIGAAGLAWLSFPAFARMSRGTRVTISIALVVLGTLAALGLALRSLGWLPF